MAIEFRGVSFPPLENFSAAAPDGAVIGVIGGRGAGKGTLLRLAAGLQAPERGHVRTSGAVRYLGASEPLDLTPVPVLLLEHALARQDAFTRRQAEIHLEGLRRAGATVLAVSHEEELLCRISDEIWWLDQGKLAARGDPGEILHHYRRQVVRRLRDWGESAPSSVAPTLRRGDGRARVLAIEVLNAACRPTLVLESGEAASIRVWVRYEQPVEDPVVGIMIRTRIGFEVYGTNTQLENVRLGSCRAGETLKLTFSFPCNLCPQQYTVTAASHDADGVWHDWLEDAVAFSVADSRYTAGVANLRARIEVER